MCFFDQTNTVASSPLGLELHKSRSSLNCFAYSAQRTWSAPVWKLMLLTHMCIILKVNYISVSNTWIWLNIHNTLRLDYLLNITLLLKLTKSCSSSSFVQFCAEDVQFVVTLASLCFRESLLQRHERPFTGGEAGVARAPWPQQVLHQRYKKEITFWIITITTRS